MITIYIILKFLQLPQTPKYKPTFRPKIFFHIYSKVGDRSPGRPGGSLFNSYYTEV